MRIIERAAAQGDVMFRRIDVLPEGVAPDKAVDGAFVVAHSETGHNHVVMERPSVKMFSGTDMLRAYLEIEGEAATVEHQRNFDTHEPFALAPGIWEIRRQREYTPEGFRKAVD